MKSGGILVRLIVYGGAVHSSPLFAGLRRGETSDCCYSGELWDMPFEGVPPKSWADGEVARARGDKDSAVGVCSRAENESDWATKSKILGYFLEVGRLDAGLSRKGKGDP